MTEPRIADKTYADWRATTLGRITERTETSVVFDLAGPLAGKRVLDIGTGDGTYAIEAAARGASVTALDVDQLMLNAATRRAAARGYSLTTQLGRAESLPFGDSTFDVVFAVTVLCFVPDAEVAASDMARVLAPNGYVVIGDLARYSAWAGKRRVAAWLGAHTWQRARFRSRRELTRLAEGAGLAVTELRGCVYFPPSGIIARIMSPLEATLTRLRAPGAAFLALRANKFAG